jgi:hypothetical protein
MLDHYVVIPWNTYCLLLQEDMCLTGILTYLQVIKVGLENLTFERLIQTSEREMYCWKVFPGKEIVQILLF